MGKNFTPKFCLIIPDKVFVRKFACTCTYTHAHTLSHSHTAVYILILKASTAPKPNNFYTLHHLL